MFGHERIQLEPGLFVLALPCLQDHLRCMPWQSVGEGLLIGEQVRALDLLEQRLQGHVRRGGNVGGGHTAGQ